MKCKNLCPRYTFPAYTEIKKEKQENLKQHKFGQAEFITPCKNPTEKEILLGDRTLLKRIPCMIYSWIKKYVIYLGITHFRFELLNFIIHLCFPLETLDLLIILRLQHKNNETIEILIKCLSS